MWTLSCNSWGTTEEMIFSLWKLQHVFVNMLPVLSQIINIKLKT